VFAIEWNLNQAFYQNTASGWDPDPAKRPPASAIIKLLDHAETKEYASKKAEWDALVGSK